MAGLNLVLFGVNHSSAPVALREKIAIQAGHLPASLQELAQAVGVEECYILSTCNRVELVARTGGRTSDHCPLERFLAGKFGIEESELKTFAYRLEERATITHLFRVASGLDSMILGEPQILGQVKEAYLAARGAGTLGSLLEPLMQRTFSVAKKVRTETGIARNAVSVATAAVEMAQQIFGDLADGSVLLLGVGKMAELAARHLVGNGVSHVVVSSRNFSHAVEMAEKFGGAAVGFDEFAGALTKADVVISSTAAPHAVIRRDMVEGVMKARRGRPLFLIDIAVPRDIQPEVNEIDNVYLYNIDDLQAVVDANREGRRREAEAAEEIVERESNAFIRRMRTAELGPTIAALRRRAEQIREGEIQRIRGRLGPLAPGQEEQIEALTRGLVNKLLHHPIQEIKRSVQERGEGGATDLARRLFDLDNDEGDNVENVSKLQRAGRRGDGSGGSE
jgi:glutamyl-tRNA reductase